jgi:microcystin degradation protein MlrC
MSKHQDPIIPRVLIGGFLHETNTFAPTRADWAAFNCGETFPAFIEGDAMVACMVGNNIPIGGFIAAARERGWSLLPSCWAGATPSAQITEDAFERLAGVIVSDVHRALETGGLDAVYLDLHGAAVAEHLDDAEGELLARIRARVGAQVAIVASLDLHANVTQQMLAIADALVAYRTYPHVDMADTGRLAAQLLERRLQRGTREPMHAIRLPFLLALNAQTTMAEPAASIYRELVALDREHDIVMSFAMGFPAADIAECGPVVWAHGDAAEAAVRRLHARIDRPRAQWRLELYAPRDAVVRALEIAGSANRPVVIADTQDNPGAGGDSNTTGMLHALLAEGAGRRFPGEVALGLMYDPRAAAAAHAAGAGAQITLALGAAVPTFSGAASDPPLVATFNVRALGDGHVVLKGPMAMQPTVELGPSACLEIDGILIAVASAKPQMLDRELFRCVGIEPERMKILVNKSSVHFRADFAPIAAAILVAKAAGPMAADPADLPWKKLSASTALRP